MKWDPLLSKNPNSSLSMGTLRVPLFFAKGSAAQVSLRWRAQEPLFRRQCLESAAGDASLRGVGEVGEDLLKDNPG